MVETQAIGQTAGIAINNDPQQFTLWKLDLQLSGGGLPCKNDGVTCRKF